MNIKKILQFNLSRLLGLKPSESQQPVFWWSRIARFFGRSRKAPNFTVGQPIGDYVPGAYYRLLVGRHWPGPVYLSTRRWQRDLMQVTRHVGAIVKINAPLTEGMEAAAHGELRMRMRLSRDGLVHLGWALSLAAVVAIFFIVLGSVLGVFERLDLMSVVFMLATCVGSLLPAALILNRGGVKEAVFLRLRDDLAAGCERSEAMGRLHRFFPRIYADMVRAGEKSGNLSTCLDKVGEETVRRIMIRRNIFPILLYLALVLTAEVLLIAFMSIKIFPVFFEIISEMEATAPPLARLWIRISQAMDAAFDKNGVAWVWMLLGLSGVLVIVFGLFAKRRRRSGLGTHPWSAPLFLVPGARGLLIRQNLVVACTILEQLLGAGVPLDQALESVVESDLHPMYREWFRRCRQRVLQGESFAVALRQEARPGLAPPSFLGISALGERSGMLHHAFGQLANLYQAVVDKRTHMLMDTIMPLGVLAIGALTVFMEATLFHLLTTMADSIIG